MPLTPEEEKLVWAMENATGGYGRESVRDLAALVRKLDAENTALRRAGNDMLESLDAREEKPDCWCVDPGVEPGVLMTCGACQWRALATPAAAPPREEGPKCAVVDCGWSERAHEIISCGHEFRTADAPTPTKEVASALAYIDETEHGGEPEGAREKVCEWVATVETVHSMFNPSTGRMEELHREKYDVVPSGAGEPE